MEYRFARRISDLASPRLRQNAPKSMSAQDTISFSYGYPPTEAFPMDTLRQISEQLYTHYDPNAFLQYASPQGYSVLRRLIKERLENVAGIRNDEDVLIVSGSTQAMDLTLKVLCNEGDVVLCEEQTFVGAVKTIRSYGAIPKPIPMNLAEQSVDLGALESMLKTDDRVKMLYLIPTFQNPLGTTMPLEQRERIYALAREYDVIIFEDDPYGDLLYDGEPVRKMKAMDVDGRVIYAGSFSKILAPGTRLGFAMAAEPLMSKLIMVKQTTDFHSNYYWQVMLSEFMLHHDFEGHVAYLRTLYRNKLDVMMAELDRLPSSLIRYIKPRGGYYICCTFAEEIDPELFYGALEERRVMVVPGNIMSVAGEGYEHCFRLNFTKPSIDEIREGVSAIGEALQIALIPSYRAIS